MEACPSDSIDYALMEKTSRAAVVEADIGWVISRSLAGVVEVAEKDADGNATYSAMCCWRIPTTRWYARNIRW